MDSLDKTEEICYNGNDESGAPIGLQYRTSDMAEDVFETYFYKKNLQGDITAICNKAGAEVVWYRYDAWGRIVSSTNVVHSENIYRTISRANPFRYRGYYYDYDLGLYYLNSRYYDPNTGRFLNADGYINANGDLIGFNMYAYCSNNPVMYIDSNGESIGSIVALVFVLVALATNLTADNHQTQLNAAKSKYNENTISRTEL